MKQTFDEKQQKLQVNGNNVMICLDEEELVTDETTKYQYDVEAFTLTEGQTLKEEVRNHMLYLIDEFDHSSRVDGFYAGGKLMWLDFDWRQKIRERINTDEEDGKTVSNFTYEGVKYEFPLATLRTMMFELEKYARDSWDRTEGNRCNMKALEDPYEMVNYEFKKGYPNQPNF